LSSRTKLSRFALDLYRSCRDLPVDRYQQAALDSLKSHVPFDAGKWVSGHMSGHVPVVHSVKLINRPPAMHTDYERIKHLDFLARETVTHVNSALLFNAIRARPDLPSEMLAYLKKWRTSHVAVCATVDPFTDLATGIALWREAPDDPFTEDQRCFFEAALPLLIETYAINRIAHVVRAAQPANAAIYASAVVDDLAQLQVAPQGFQKMLLQEWPDWRGYRLPGEIGHLAQGAGARYVGRKVFFRSSRVHDLVLVQARDKRAADELTIRQREIAQLAANGYTYDQIAGRLTISPGTVRTHLGAVYKKLDVHKRAGVAVKLRDAE
jgi:DNA-binding CsgD family transcriptional regulator